MSWIGNLWRGMSPCMEPGIDGCVVWWDAWAAIGTSAAVAVALLTPLVRQRLNSRRLNAIIALQFGDEIAMASATLKILADHYPVGKEDYRRTGERLSLDAEYRNAMAGGVRWLKRLGDASLDFGQLPEGAELKAVVIFATAIHCCKALGTTVEELASSEDGGSVEDWLEAMQVYEREYVRANASVARALSFCQECLSNVDPVR
ncbi:UNVERIFIED_ORG: hypothetical protein ABIC77_000296 [Stenotrophomonas geniculata]